MPDLGLIDEIWNARIASAAKCREAATALAAAFLNSVFWFCLGCEMYLFIRRIRPSQAA